MRGDVRALLVVALSIAIAASCALAQASSGGASKPAAQPPAVVVAEDEPSPPHIHFDVVSFKPCKEGIALTMKITIMPPDGDSIGYHCQTIGRILSFAYAGKQPFRLRRAGVGGHRCVRFSGEGCAGRRCGMAEDEPRRKEGDGAGDVGRGAESEDAR